MSKSKESNELFESTDGDNFAIGKSASSTMRVSESVTYNTMKDSFKSHIDFIKKK